MKILQYNFNEYKHVKLILTGKFTSIYATN